MLNNETYKVYSITSGMNMISRAIRMSRKINLGLCRSEYLWDGINFSMENLNSSFGKKSMLNPLLGIKSVIPYIGIEYGMGSIPGMTTSINIQNDKNMQMIQGFIMMIMGILMEMGKVDNKPSEIPKNINGIGQTPTKSYLKKPLKRGEVLGIMENKFPKINFMEFPRMDK